MNKNTRVEILNHVMKNWEFRIHLREHRRFIDFETVQNDEIRKLICVWCRIYAPFNKYVSINFWDEILSVLRIIFQFPSFKEMLINLN